MQAGRSGDRPTTVTFVFSRGPVSHHQAANRCKEECGGTPSTEFHFYLRTSCGGLFVHCLIKPSAGVSFFPDSSIVGFWGGSSFSIG